MPPPDAARLHYLAQQAITAGIVRRAQRLWANLDPSALDESWRRDRVGEQLYVTTSAGQLATAGAADRYIDDILDELDIDPTPTGSVNARAFAGVASDGRSLESLLYEPVIAAKVAAVGGAADPFRVGESSLVRIVATQVKDAGRAAVATGIASRTAVTGYVRMLVPPSCSRCAVLAGKKFRWNTGFARHPHCDCRHIPTSEDVAGELTTNPREYFDSLTADQQARYFTNAGAAAIREGADIGQVVNARRGMTAAGATLEGTTRRGFAGRRAASRGGDAFTGERTGRYRRTTRARLMPEQIMETSRSRDEAVELLREHGYLI